MDPNLNQAAPLTLEQRMEILSQQNLGLMQNNAALNARIGKIENDFSTIFNDIITQVVNHLKANPPAQAAASPTGQPSMAALNPAADIQSSASPATTPARSSAATTDKARVPANYKDYVQVMALLETGMKQKDVADKLGIPPTTISGYKKWTPEKVAEMKAKAGDVNESQLAAMAQATVQPEFVQPGQAQPTPQKHIRRSTTYYKMDGTYFGVVEPTWGEDRAPITQWVVAPEAGDGREYGYNPMGQPICFRIHREEHYLGAGHDIVGQDGQVVPPTNPFPASPAQEVAAPVSGQQPTAPATAAPAAPAANPVYDPAAAYPGLYGTEFPGTDAMRPQPPATAPALEMPYVPPNQAPIMMPGQAVPGYPQPVAQPQTMYGQLEPGRVLVAYLKCNGPQGSVFMAPMYEGDAIDPANPNIVFIQR